MREICAKSEVQFHSCHDLMLAKIGSIMKSEGEPYRVFSQFYRAILNRSIDHLRRN